MGTLAGLSEPVPHEIAFLPQKVDALNEAIKSLVEKFLATATPEEKADFWLRYDQIGQELRERLDHPSEASLPSSEEIEMYSKSVDYLAIDYTSSASGGQQAAPALHESTDTTTTANGSETPPEVK